MTRTFDQRVEEAKQVFQQLDRLGYNMEPAKGTATLLLWHKDDSKALYQFALGTSGLPAEETMLAVKALAAQAGLNNEHLLQSGDEARIRADAVPARMTPYTLSLLPPSESHQLIEDATAKGLMAIHITPVSHTKIAHKMRGQVRAHVSLSELLPHRAHQDLSTGTGETREEDSLFHTPVPEASLNPPRMRPSSRTLRLDDRRVHVVFATPLDEHGDKDKLRQSFGAALHRLRHTMHMDSDEALARRLNTLPPVPPTNNVLRGGYDADLVQRVQNGTEPLTAELVHAFTRALHDVDHELHQRFQTMHTFEQRQNYWQERARHGADEADLEQISIYRSGAKSFLPDSITHLAHSMSEDPDSLLHGQSPIVIASDLNAFFNEKSLNRATNVPYEKFDRYRTALAAVVPSNHREDFLERLDRLHSSIAEYHEAKSDKGIA